LRFRILPDLVEGATRARMESLERYGEVALVRSFHEDLGSLESSRPSEPVAAWDRLFATWFRRLGLDRSLIEIATEFPRLADRIEVRLRPCGLREDEGGRLLARDAIAADPVAGVDSSGRADANLDASPPAKPAEIVARPATLTLRVRPDRFLDPVATAAFLRHHLRLAEDVLVQEEDAGPPLPDPETAATLRPLLLRAVHADGRIQRGSRVGLRSLAGWREQVRLAFPTFDAAAREDLLLAVWRGDARAMEEQLRRIEHPSLPEEAAS